MDNILGILKECDVTMILAFIVLYFLLEHKNKKRFEKIVQRLEKMEHRFEKIDQRFEKMEHRFEKIET